MDSVRASSVSSYEFRKRTYCCAAILFAGHAQHGYDFWIDDRCVAGIAWDGKANPAPSLNGPRWARGRGMALSLRHGSQGGGRAYALVTLDAQGVLTIQHNAPEIGQGTHNLFSVVASQTLNLPQSQIRVGTPDTAVNLPFAGVSAQRTTMQMGNAVHNACKTLQEDLLGLAAQVKGGEAKDWPWLEIRSRLEG